jgi:hypothetical protein
MIVQMIAQRLRRGKKCFKRRLFDVLRRGTLIARVEIIVEIRSKIDFVERIGRLLIDGFRTLGGDHRLADSRLGIAQRRGCDLRRVRLRGVIDGGSIGNFENRLIGRFGKPLGFE